MAPTTSKNKGFTLIELAIAIAVIGIIVAMLFNKFGKSFITTAKAEAVYSHSKEVIESFKLLTNLCGTVSDPGTSTLTKATPGWPQILSMLKNPEDSTYGIDKTKYRRCYAQSGFTGLPILWRDTTNGYAAWDYWKLGSDMNAFAFVSDFGGKPTVYMYLPIDIVEQLWLNYNDVGSTSFAASDAWANNMNYNKASVVNGGIFFKMTI